MPFTRLLSATVAALVASAVIGLAAPAHAQEPILEFDVADVTVYNGQTGLTIPIHLSNYTETAKGFQFWITLSRPDIILFRTSMYFVYDTVYWRCDEWQGDDCIDSSVVPETGPWDFFHIDSLEVEFQTIDTTGSVISGWEYVYGGSIGGMGTDLQVTGYADMYAPYDNPGLLPQEGGLLLNLVADAATLPDTMTERTVNLMVNTMGSAFCFTSPGGYCIGYTYELVDDTTCWVCLEWAGQDCLQWMQSQVEPCDSISVEQVLVGSLDTSLAKVYDGSVTIGGHYSYGDVNCDHQPDISDLIEVVDFMFANGLEVACPWNVECDDDNMITIVDLVCLVEWMFPTP